MPRSRDVRVTRVLQRVACVRAVDWFLLSTCVQEKQRSGRAFAVHRWAGGLWAFSALFCGRFRVGQGFPIQQVALMASCRAASAWSRGLRKIAPEIHANAVRGVDSGVDGEIMRI